MNKEKIAALFQDEAFVKELATKGQAEDAQKLFASKGVTVSIDELKALRAGIKQEVGEELTEEELELVAGGNAGNIIGDVINIAGGITNQGIKLVSNVGTALGSVKTGAITGGVDIAAQALSSLARLAGNW